MALPFATAWQHFWIFSFYVSQSSAKKESLKSLLFIEGRRKKLNDFLEKHCEVCIIEFKEPWQVEESVIENYAPPLNIEYNKKGWHYKNMRKFRKISRTRSIPFE